MITFPHPTTSSLSRRLGSLIHRCSLLSTTIASLLVASPGFAEVLIYDDFPTNGTLTGTTPAVGGRWTTISGTTNQFQVVNNRLQLTDSDSEDVTSSFGEDVTRGKIYYGFDVSVADPGSYTGTDFEYFAHWTTTSSFISRTDVAAFSAAGWRPGQGGRSSTAEVVWGSDLAYGTDYRLVVGHDFTTGLSSLWVDPTAESDTSIVTTSAITGFTAQGFNFRQSAATPNQDYSIGRLRVATTFDEVLVGVVPEPSSLAMLGLGGLLVARRRR